MKNFQTELSFAQPPKEVFDAVLAVNRWWSAALEGNSARKGDEFIYRHGTLHYSKHRITEVIKNRKVVWLTLESRLAFVSQRSEWNGSQVIFQVKPKGDQTLLFFTHQGLHPGLACYEGCSQGWNYHLDSLSKLILTGDGHPDKVEAMEKQSQKT